MLTGGRPAARPTLTGPIRRRYQLERVIRFPSAAQCQYPKIVNDLSLEWSTFTVN